MNATVVVILDGQAFRLQCNMTVDDEEVFQNALVSDSPVNLEIEAVKMWALIGTKSGGIVCINRKDKNETV